MNKTMKNRTIILLLAVMVLPTVVFAQRTITVVGSAGVDTKPDYAIVSMMISAQDQTAQAVFARNEESARNLVKSLTGAGVAAADIEQQGSALNPSYDYSGGGGNPPKLSGYHLIATYEVKVRSLKDLPKVIDAGTLAGASNVSIGSYGVATKDALEDKARTKALEEAREKAGELAEQMGGKLGEIISISDAEAEGSSSQMGRGEEEERRGMIVAGSNPQKIRRSASLKVTFSVK
jgi:uncharacterized protein YggE